MHTLFVQYIRRLGLCQPRGANLTNCNIYVIMYAKTNQSGNTMKDDKKTIALLEARVETLETELNKLRETVAAIDELTALLHHFIFI